MNARDYIGISSIIVFIGLLIACFGHVQCASNVIAQVSHFHAKESRDKLREGDTFNITCTADYLESILTFCDNLSEIYIEKTNDKKYFKPDIINETSVFYEVNSTMAKHPKEYGYSCMCKKHSLNTAYFMIGIKLNITDFNCKFIDTSEPNLSCSFSTPAKLSAIDPATKFFMEYKYHNFSCEYNENRTVCTVPNDFFKDYKFSSKHNFKIFMQDQLGTQNEQFSRSKEECIVLVTPENVNKISLNSNSICLNWTDNQKDNYKPLYTIEWLLNLEPKEDNRKWLQQPTGSHLSDSYCLEGLSLPYQEYTLTARRRLNDSRVRWSEPFNYTFITAPTIPSRPPIVWPGGYQFNTHNSSELHVYWQQIQTFERNGPEFKYNVEVRNSQDNTQVKNLDVQVDINMASIRNFPSSGRYEILIRSENSVGMSENSSKLFISHEAGSEKRIPTFLNISKEEDIISWQPPEQREQLIGYTIYWCIASLTDRNRCNDSMAIETDRVDAQRNYYHPKMDIDDSYEWAVSANYNGTILSGGMIWRQWTPHVISNFDHRIHSWEGVLALLVLGGCLYLLFRKYKYMSNIEVDLPPGVLLDKTEHIELLPDQHSNQNRSASLNPADEVPKILSANIKPLDLDLSTVAAEIDSWIPPSPVSVCSISSSNLSSASSLSTTEYVSCDPQTNSREPDYTKLKSIPVNSNSQTNSSEPDYTKMQSIPVNSKPIPKPNPISGYVQAPAFYR
ncbi:cytokine receptor [Drosophila innubila]|uniref:cytokine receptor n=1 Tax=Drosophila innubila TaxID=198719 RepID=UPI00148D6D00|nr:cytokine receptor [Drosophila innubila]